MALTPLNFNVVVFAIHYTSLTLPCFSCDKYWHCQDGFADLKTCGNGLGFLDTDDTFTLEQCAELHLVECGARTEIEPPISTDHCPRLYGTFPDEQDCGVFWKCQDGKPNKYNCPPGLAYDQVKLPKMLSLSDISLPPGVPRMSLG